MVCMRGFVFLEIFKVLIKLTPDHWVFYKNLIRLAWPILIRLNSIWHALFKVLFDRVFLVSYLILLSVILLLIRMELLFNLIVNKRAFELDSDCCWTFSTSNYFMMEWITSWLCLFLDLLLFIVNLLLFFNDLGSSFFNLFLNFLLRLFHFILFLFSRTFNLRWNSFIFKLLFARRLDFQTLFSIIIFNSFSNLVVVWIIFLRPLICSMSLA